MLFSSTKGLRFDKRGLIPAIIQDAESKKVLMYVYMNREAVKKTKKTGQLWLYHRSMKKTWKKGTRSGNTMEVVDMLLHHDRNVMVVQVIPSGPACHTGNESCFVESYLRAPKTKDRQEPDETTGDSDDSLEALRKLFETHSDEIEVVTEKGDRGEDLLASLFAEEEEAETENEKGSALESEETVQSVPEVPASGENGEADFLERYYRTVRQKVLTPETLGQEDSVSLDATQVVQKISEAAVQLAVAAAQNHSDALLEKEADIVQHLLLLLAAKGIPVDRLKQRLENRLG